ncbi:sigma-70 family RNA polymerase sigma factor [Microbispora cellulosiformans]|uniref:RNA polymerase sigma factor n=1 Tax=Microbispora cellulosiformans TaxID=2614688 RepID=A0A5J5KDR8_9ACTN|nr:sigma-70 family RNA polymerase sigma factor [Microbispora cellulosiformans]
MSPSGDGSRDGSREAGHTAEPLRRFVREEGVSPAGTADEELVRALFDDHAGPLYGYVLRLTGDPGRAEDVVQETLLRAWRNPGVLEGRPVRAWLFTVARNIVVDQHRARRSRPQETGDEALAVLPADDELDRAVESWGVAEALASLRPEHREVLMETYYRGRSVKEASEVLGIPQGTVKSRTYYALRALKLALEERGLAP